jgi:hypothetical protein
MLRSPIIIVVLAAMLMCAAPAQAFDCTLNPIVRNGKEVGTAVISGIDKYCGSVQRTGGGYRVKLDGRSSEFFNASYKYRDVLEYMCDYCDYKKADIFSGQ